LCKGVHFCAKKIQIFLIPDFSIFFYVIFEKGHNFAPEYSDFFIVDFFKFILATWQNKL